MIVSSGHYRPGMSFEDYWKNLSDEDTFIVHDIFFDIIDNWNSVLAKPDSFTNYAWITLIRATREYIQKEAL